MTDAEKLRQQANDFERLAGQYRRLATDIEHPTRPHEERADFARHVGIMARSVLRALVEEWV